MVTGRIPQQAPCALYKLLNNLKKPDELSHLFFCLCTESIEFGFIFQSHNKCVEKFCAIYAHQCLALLSLLHRDRKGGLTSTEKLVEHIYTLLNMLWKPSPSVSRQTDVSQGLHSSALLVLQLVPGQQALPHC